MRSVRRSLPSPIWRLIHQGINTPYGVPPGIHRCKRIGVKKKEAILEQVKTNPEKLRKLTKQQLIDNIVAMGEALCRTQTRVRTEYDEALQEIGAEVIFDGEQEKIDKKVITARCVRAEKETVEGLATIWQCNIDNPTELNEFKL